MSDDDKKADSTLPAQTSELKETDITELHNAAAAARAAIAKRGARLKPIKLQSTDKPHTLRYCPDDELAALRVLETFAVGDNNAADLLMNALVRVTVAGGESDTVAVANGELEPRDPMESMLCSQMTATHLLTMECFRRANVTGQSFEGREMNMRHAERLSRIYAQQVDTLNKHRGKGQQKVTVEHVTVNAGGQAVVGNVEK
jgi:hypothetical protein